MVSQLQFKGRKEKNKVAGWDVGGGKGGRREGTNMWWVEFFPNQYLHSKRKAEVFCNY